MFHTHIPNRKLRKDLLAKLMLLINLSNRILVKELLNVFTHAHPIEKKGLKKEPPTLHTFHIH